MQQIANAEVGVILQKEQVEWVAKEVKEYLKPKMQGAILVATAFFLLIVDRDLKLFSEILFALGVIRWIV